MAGRNLFNNGPLQGRFIEKAKNYKPGFVASFQDADTIKSCGFAFPSAAGSSGDALKLLSVADGTTEWGSAGGGGGQTVEAALTSADAGSTLAPSGTDVIYPVSIDADYTITSADAAPGDTRSRRRSLKGTLECQFFILKETTKAPKGYFRSAPITQTGLLNIRGIILNLKNG